MASLAPGPLALALSVATLLAIAPGPTGATDVDDPRLRHLPYQRGDTVVVRVEGAEFMSHNQKLIANLPIGTRIDVAKVAVAWVGGYAELDGRRRLGWIHAKDVEEAPPIEPDGAL